jgi:hypothetical protein
MTAITGCGLIFAFDFPVRGESKFVASKQINRANQTVDYMYRNYKGPFRRSSQAIWASCHPLMTPEIEDRELKIAIAVDSK